MKTLLKIRRIAMVVLVAALGCWTSPAFANTTIIISENAAGPQLTGSNPANSFTVVEGAVVICEEGTTAPCLSSPSDIVIFQNQSSIFTFATFGTFGICSDMDFTPADGVADAGSQFVNSATCPSPPSDLPKLYLVEPAGGGDITYTPTAGQPGFAPDPTYIIKADPATNVVPEPASLLLIGSGLCALAVRLRRRASSCSVLKREAE